MAEQRRLFNVSCHLQRNDCETRHPSRQPLCFLLFIAATGEYPDVLL